MKALIVDDNADIRMLLDRVLKMAGFDVVAAEGGREALKILESTELPDLVVLDVQMPVMDGWDTLSEIRSIPGLHDVPVVMCTVKGSPTNEERGWALGCDGYVAKPFDIRLLISTLTEVVHLSEAERRDLRQAGIARAQRLRTLGVP